MEQVGETILDRGGGQHQPEHSVDGTDTGADEGFVALDLGAFINDARAETIAAQIGQRRGIDAFDAVAIFTDARLKFPVAGDDQFRADELLLTASDS